MTCQPTIEDFATALKCKAKFVHTRLVALGHYNECSRCGGCGRYSFNMLDGDMCYGCYGSGKQAVKLTPELLRTVEQEVSEGKLQPYLDMCAAKHYAKTFMNRYFETWKAIPSVKACEHLHWTKQSRECAATNKIVCGRLDNEVNPIIQVIENRNASIEDVIECKKKLEVILAEISALP